MTMTTTSTSPAPPSIKRYYDPIKATRDLREYDADITVEFMRQPGLYAWYSSLLVQAEAQHDRLVNSVDILHARLDLAIRHEAAKTGAKLTEKQVACKIMLDNNMIALSKMARDAKSEVGYLKGACAALVQRKDMLMQMGFLTRKEQDASGMTVMKSSMQEIHDGRMERLADKFTDLS